ncbi:MAG TPA: hypothetical protein ENK46_04925 [Flavobacteriia bacterium]|nr:hypothetical protein [Flavobacteriia bacterium]
MKKIISIVLMSLILIQTSEASISDVLQLKSLFQHAKFHQQMYGDSFFEFLSEHYGQKAYEHRNEHKEHHDLPLKNHQNIINALTVFVVCISHFTIKEQTFIETASNFFYKEPTSSFEKPSVFQPPKFT